MGESERILRLEPKEAFWHPRFGTVILFSITTDAFDEGRAVAMKVFKEPETEAQDTVNAFLHGFYS